MKRGIAVALLVAVGFAAAASGAVAAAAAPPSEDFLRKPKFSLMRLSPDGKLLAAVVPINGRRNLALIDLDKNRIVALTNLKEQDVYTCGWIGDQTLQVQIANLGETGSERSSRTIDIYRYNPRTNDRRLLTNDSPADVQKFVADRAGQVRVAVSVPRGATRSKLYYRRDNDAKWVLLRDDPIEEDPIRPIAFDFDNKTLYVVARTAGGAGLFDVYAFDLRRTSSVRGSAR